MASPFDIKFAISCRLSDYIVDHNAASWPPAISITTCMYSKYYGMSGDEAVECDSRIVSNLPRSWNKPKPKMFHEMPSLDYYFW